MMNNITCKLGKQFSFYRLTTNQMHQLANPFANSRQAMCHQIQLTILSRFGCEFIKNISNLCVQICIYIFLPQLYCTYCTCHEFAVTAAYIYVWPCPNSSRRAVLQYLYHRYHTCKATHLWVCRFSDQVVYPIRYSTYLHALLSPVVLAQEICFMCFKEDKNSSTIVELSWSFIHPRNSNP